MRVDNTPLREAFERSEMSAAQLAREAGIMKPDTTQVQRLLGIKGWRPAKNTKLYFAQTISEEHAIKMAEILGLDPIDIEV